MRILLFLGFCAITVPIAFYSYHFGFGIWEKHEDWAYLGTFFGGVVGPLITALTLVFLGKQINIQQNHNLANECETDLLRYLPILKSYFSENEFANRRGLELTHIECLRHIDNQELENAKSVARKYCNDEIVAMSQWTHVDAVMRTLYKLSKYKFRRMRVLILSELDMELIYHLHGMSQYLVENKKTSILFKDVEQRKMKEKVMQQ